jgi:hypothetical protein
MAIEVSVGAGRCDGLSRSTASIRCVGTHLIGNDAQEKLIQLLPKGNETKRFRPAHPLDRLIKRGGVAMG